MTTWRCGAARDLPIDTDSAWDGDAAAQSIFDWAGFDGDSPDGAKARRGFLAYDADNTDQKGGYKLPIAQVSSGKLTAVRSGLRAAASRLPQADGLGEDTKNAARNVLDAYFKRIDSDGDDEESRSPVMLARLDIRKSLAYDPSEPLPEGIARQVWDPSVLDDGPPFLFTLAASTGQVDTFHTRMLPSSLKNFAEDAQHGISICNSHKTNELPFGRTFDGRYVAGGQGGNSSARAEMDGFVPRGMNVNGVDTDHIIRSIRWGVGRDASVGFFGGKTRCSLCGKDMMNDLMSLLFFGFDGENANDPEAPCWHLPGMEYPVRDRRGETTGEKKVAIGEIDGARCAEVSLVFDGATPGAGVMNGRRCIAIAKAERMAHIGVLGRRSANALLHRYRVRSTAIEDVVRTRYALGGIDPSIDTSDSDLNPEPAELPVDARAEVTAVTASVGEMAEAVFQRVRNELIGVVAIAEQPSTLLAVEPSSQAASPGAEETTREVEESTHMPEPSVAGEHNAPAESSVASVAAASGPAPASPPVRETVAAAGQGAVGETSRPPVPSDETREAQIAQAQRAAWKAVRSAMITARLLPEDFAGEIIEGIRDLGNEVERLRGWAAIGQKARTQLVEQIREEGVRALGAEGLPEDVYGPTLESGSYSQLVALKTHLEALAGRRFQSGRASEEVQEQNPPSPEQNNNNHQQQQPKYVRPEESVSLYRVGR